MDGKLQSARDRGGRFRATLRGGLRMKLLVALLGLTITAASADWPMHRGGPQLQGRAEMPAPAKPDLAWTYAAGKPIKAAAAIAGGRVFFGDDAGIIHAVDFATG